jgi:hypothetical protein
VFFVKFVTVQHSKCINFTKVKIRNLFVKIKAGLSATFGVGVIV